MHQSLRYGCTILRHYLDLEKGNLFRALGYNGSLGKAGTCLEPGPRRLGDTGSGRRSGLPLRPPTLDATTSSR